MDQDIRPPGRRVRSRTFVAALGLLTALALAGCTGGEGPGASTSAPPPAPTDATAEVSEPEGSVGSADPGAEESEAAASASVLPDGSTAATDEGPAQDVPTPEMPEVVWSDEPSGAEAAALHYYETYRYMIRTGETGPYLEITPECDGCRDVAERYERLYRAGGWAGGRDHEVTLVDREDVFGYLSSQVTVHVVEDSGYVWFRPDEDDSPAERKELAEIGQAMTSDDPPWHVDQHEALDVYQSDVADHWVVRDFPRRPAEHPETFEGFTIRDRG